MDVVNGKESELAAFAEAGRDSRHWPPAAFPKKDQILGMGGTPRCGSEAGRLRVPLEPPPN